MKKFTFKTVCVVGATLLLSTSCQKEASMPVQSQTDAVAVAKKSADANNVMVDLVARMNGIALSKSTAMTSNSPELFMGPADQAGKCGSITIAPLGSAFPKTITADFGEGCAIEGVTYKGKIIGTIYAPPTVVGSKVTLGFDKFSYNNIAVTGSAEYTNNGKNMSGNYTYSVKADLKRTGTPEQTYGLKLAVDAEFIKGAATTDIADDEFSITGSGALTDAANTSYSITIIKPLIKKMSCNWISSGTVENKFGSQAPSTLDFGNGTCDDKGTFTRKGVSQEVTLY